MFPSNPTSQGRFSTVKKSHKAILGALLISEKPLRPYNRGAKIFWTLDFLAPSGPFWDTQHPLIVPDRKVGEMIDLVLLTPPKEDSVFLSIAGASIANGSEHDWTSYWSYFYDRKYGHRFDWIRYFKTGIIYTNLG